ncbi:hypothetical protein [Flavobacterium sp. UBA6031]|uniref:hypothetical protein n=1 Tax=Flavobacterium sp. UBA6031 TaxID=1946551 RepID=UPI0025BB9291|nr:hypothetical protein [Flavobacterium sp. UBA6031]
MKNLVKLFENIINMFFTDFRNFKMDNQFIFVSTELNKENIKSYVKNIMPKLSQKKFFSTVFALVIGSVSILLSAQYSLNLKVDTLNPQIRKIAKSDSKPNWINFKTDSKINPKTIFVEYKSAFDLKENDKMMLVKTEKIDSEITLYKYQQYFKDVKIEGGEFIVHTDKDYFTNSANGKLFTDIDINVVPTLNAKQSIDIALDHISAKEYKWESEFWKNELKTKTGKPDTSYYPVPQLVIRQIRNRNQQSNIQKKQFFLVYMLDIYSSSPNYAQRIFIDANTGDVLETLPLQSN